MNLYNAKETKGGGAEEITIGRTNERDCEGTSGEGEKEINVRTFL
jgi:hypothetical protein